MAKSDVQAQPKKEDKKSPVAAEPPKPQAKSVRYKATARGYCGVKIREPGEVFDFDGKPGSWMVPLKDAKAAEAKQEPKASEPSQEPVASVEAI